MNLVTSPSRNQTSVVVKSTAATESQRAFREISHVVCFFHSVAVVKMSGSARNVESLKFFSVLHLLQSVKEYHRMWNVQSLKAEHRIDLRAEISASDACLPSASRLRQKAPAERTNMFALWRKSIPAEGIYFEQSIQSCPSHSQSLSRSQPSRCRSWCCTS